LCPRAGSSSILVDNSPYDALLDNNNSSDEDRDDVDDLEGRAAAKGAKSTRRAVSVDDGPVPYNYSFFHLIFALASM
jgi:hypothetical protein